MQMCTQSQSLRYALSTSGYVAYQNATVCKFKLQVVLAAVQARKPRFRAVRSSVVPSDTVTAAGLRKDVVSLTALNVGAIAASQTLKRATVPSQGQEAALHCIMVGAVGKAVATPTRLWFLLSQA
mmetsp:Transcript_134055/g.267505  ORF Transcript_134055/g.267505 Transcript_134055/m.267505 type:complete len:125 (-) Transcript_134055:424-798(-)